MTGLGGVHATANPELNVKDRNYDYVMCGEGEEMLPQLMHKSGCVYVDIAIESGTERILHDVIQNGMKATDEFTPRDMSILRAYEWDRINFKTFEKRKKIADMMGISVEELDGIRRNTRMTLEL